MAFEGPYTAASFDPCDLPFKSGPSLPSIAPASLNPERFWSSSTHYLLKTPNSEREIHLAA